MSAAPGGGPRDATPITRARNQTVREAPPFADTQDFDDAARGLVASLPEVEITNAQGRVVWSLRDYAFLSEVEAPPTVNPSLWRQARLNMHHGLFQVTDRIYQIRGFDVSNMTILEGERGIVIIDPLISTETARAGLEQTLRLMNHGWRAAEIAERLAPPPSLASAWHTRSYYGTFSHNAKSVYQRYLGWYDANPANLNPLPPVERARKYVEYMGGSDAVLARARLDFEAGEYRFVADALSHVVFADPGHTQARELAAAALEQMGHVAESATWRNAYLLGALELRQGVPATTARAPVSPDVVRAMSLDLFFDYLAVRLDGEKADGKRLVVNWTCADLGRHYVLTLEHGALTYLADRRRAEADVTITLDRPVLDRLVLRELTLPDAQARGLVTVAGNAAGLAELFSLLDDFTLMFPIVEPRRS